jgi:hypothetical protein
VSLEVVELLVLRYCTWLGDWYILDLDMKVWPFVDHYACLTRLRDVERLYLFVCHVENGRMLQLR